MLEFFKNTGSMKYFHRFISCNIRFWVYTVVHWSVGHYSFDLTDIFSINFVPLISWNIGQCGVTLWNFIPINTMTSFSKVSTNIITSIPGRPIGLAAIIVKMSISNYQMPSIILSLISFREWISQQNLASRASPSRDVICDEKPISSKTYQQ